MFFFCQMSAVYVYTHAFFVVYIGERKSNGTLYVAFDIRCRVSSLKIVLCFRMKTFYTYIVLKTLITLSKNVESNTTHSQNESINVCFYPIWLRSAKMVSYLFSLFLYSSCIGGTYSN